MSSWKCRQCDKNWEDNEWFQTEKQCKVWWEIKYEDIHPNAAYGSRYLYLMGLLSVGRSSSVFWGHLRLFVSHGTLEIHIQTLIPHPVSSQDPLHSMLMIPYTKYFKPSLPLLPSTSGAVQSIVYTELNITNFPCFQSRRWQPLYKVLVPMVSHNVCV